MERRQQPDAASRRLLLEEEHLALRAIYGDDAFVEEGPHAPSSFLLAVPLSDRRSPAAALRLHFPDAYPAAEPPVYELTSQYVGASRVTDALLEELDAAFREAWTPGEVVVFAWAEILREKFEGILQAEAEAEAGSGERAGEEEEEEEEDGEEEDGGGKRVALYEDFEEVPPAAAAAAARPNVVAGGPAAPCPPIAFGVPVVDRKSTFQASLARVSSPDEVRAVRSALLKNSRVARAAHPVICAYRIRMPNGGILQDNDDDGEKAAGGRLLHLLQVLEVEGVAVFCTRWFGGILLGADRFKHINNAARAILEQEGFISKHAGAKDKAPQSKKRSKR